MERGREVRWLLLDLHVLKQLLLLRLGDSLILPLVRSKLQTGIQIRHDKRGMLATLITKLVLQADHVVVEPVLRGCHGRQ